MGNQKNPKHMLKLMEKKIFILLCSNILFMMTYAIRYNDLANSVLQGLYAMSMNCMEAAEAQFHTAIGVSNLL